MKKNQLQKLALSLCALGILFTSSEKEEMNEEIDTAALEIETAPFTNYMVITGSTELSKSVENYLKISGGEIINTIPEIGIAIVSSKDANFIQNTLKNTEVLSVVPDYEFKWIPSTVGQEVVPPSEEVTPPSVGNLEPFYGYLWGMDAIDAPQAWN